MPDSDDGDEDFSELTFQPHRFLQYRRGNDPSCEHRRVTMSPSSSSWFVQRRVVCMDCQAMAGYVAGSMHHVTTDLPDISRWNPDTQKVDPHPKGRQRSSWEESHLAVTYATLTGAEWRKYVKDNPELVPACRSRTMAVLHSQEHYERLLSEQDERLGIRMARLRAEMEGGSGNLHYSLWFEDED